MVSESDFEQFEANDRLLSVSDVRDDIITVRRSKEFGLTET